MCHEQAMARSDGAELVVIDDRVIAAASRAHPGVTNINVTQSSRFHIGPKFVSVTQNVDNTEVVKELSLARYLWDVAKSTTRTERVSCAAALSVLTVCILLVVYYTVIAKQTAESVADVAPHEWFITRKMWLAPPFQNDGVTTDLFDPLRLVIIAHTVGTDCTVFRNCAAELQNLQNYCTWRYNYDLPYNFLIGNDGRVYVGRGWNVVGAHTQGYDRCSLCIAFIGDYSEGSPSYSIVSELQLQRAQMLLDLGVQLNHLDEYYHVLGARDLKATRSPGTSLYNVIRQWPHYDHNNIYKGKTCEQIRDSYQNQTSAASLT